MNDSKVRQQIVDKIKSSSNILVTVSSSPSVDALSAALGLTILLNKLEKHATAVFSGGIPPAITFLDPQKTFENTVDSLRDFIIALDKEKADHLRYKVDGDVVKIFITPYRTTIGADDLEFSQGDYNVELVLALGVASQDNLDEALAAHGRILHDATVVTVSADQKSELGGIDWTDSSASSLSEMVATLADGLKKDKSLLDEQTATAFMTGIVAATDRFSNDRTTPHVMTVAAQLMGAGANQQLIAAELEQASAIGVKEEPTINSDGTTELNEDKPTKLEKQKEPEPVETPRPNGELVISHEKKGDLDEVARQTAAEKQRQAAKKAEEALARETAAREEQDSRKKEEALTEDLKSVAPAASAKPSVADLQKDLAEASDELDKAATQSPEIQQPQAVSQEQPSMPSLVNNVVGDDKWRNSEHEPLMGGTLNATAEQAALDSRKAEEADRNKTILSHGGSYVDGAQPAFQSPINAAAQPEPELPGIDMFKETSPLGGQTRAATIQPPETPVAPPEPELAFEPAPVPAPEPITPPSQTLADIDRAARGVAPVESPDQSSPDAHDEARAAVQNALDAQPPQLPPLPPLPQATPAGAVDFTPGAAPEPAALNQPPQTPAGLPPLPPLPDFSTLPPLPPSPSVDAATPQPQMTAPAPELPSTSLPPDEKLGDMLAPAPNQPAQPEVSNDPKQYRIPGQG